MIPEWLSFSNELFPSPHRFMYMYLFKWYHNEISFSYKSFRNEFIPFFNPNEIHFLVRNFILVLRKLKTNFRLFFFWKSKNIFKKNRKAWLRTYLHARWLCFLIVFLRRVELKEHVFYFLVGIKTFAISAYV